MHARKRCLKEVKGHQQLLHGSSHRMSRIRCTPNISFYYISTLTLHWWNYCRLPTFRHSFAKQPRTSSTWGLWQTSSCLVCTSTHSLFLTKRGCQTLSSRSCIVLSYCVMPKPWSISCLVCTSTHSLSLTKRWCQTLSSRSYIALVLCPNHGQSAASCVPPHTIYSWPSVGVNLSLADCIVYGLKHAQNPHTRNPPDHHSSWLSSHDFIASSAHCFVHIPSTCTSSLYSRQAWL